VENVEEENVSIGKEVTNVYAGKGSEDLVKVASVNFSKSLFII
jgi:hypothetical protein